MKQASGTEKANLSPDIKAKWLEALRSGSIKQAKGRLITEQGEMCCLGVLEHVCGTPHKLIARYSGDLSIKSPGTGDREYRGVPLDVRNELANLNDGISTLDGNPVPFPKIADWIEKNL